MIGAGSASADKPFRDLRRAVGNGFFVIAFLGRLPVAMVIVGVLTMITAARGSLLEAGVTAAVIGICTGVGGPLIGAAADRWGQRRVLTIGALVNSTGLTLLVVAVYSPTSLQTIVAVAAATGLGSPHLSPLTRARWIGLINAGADESVTARTTAAMSYEAMADELSFFLGPAAVGVLATVVHPAAPLLVAAALTLVFVTAFAWHRTTSRVLPRPLNEPLGAAAIVEGVGRSQSLLRTGILLPAVGMLFIGAFFGSTLAAVTEFLRERGEETLTGITYSALGLATAVIAVLLPRLPARFQLGTRWIASAALLLGSAILMSWVGGVFGIVAVLLLAGLGVGLGIITIFELGASASPPGRVSTTMTMLNSGITIGQAIAMGLAGLVAELYGYSGLTALLVAGTVLGLLVAILGGRTNLRSAR